MSFLNRRLDADHLGSDLYIGTPAGEYRGNVSAAELISTFSVQELPTILLSLEPHTKLEITRHEPVQNGLVMTVKQVRRGSWAD